MDRVHERLHKLLAMAADASSPQEAAIAQELAKLLLERHGLYRSDIEMETPSVESVELDRSKRLVPWRSLLARGLAAFVGCGSYVQRTWTEGRLSVRFVVVGRPGDIRSMKYLYQAITRALNQEADRAWKAMQHGSSARSWKRRFRIGAAVRVSERLQDARHRAEADAAGHELVLAREDVEAVMADIRLGKARTVVVRAIDGAILAGRAAGDRVPLGSGPGLPSPSPQLTGQP